MSAPDSGWPLRAWVVARLALGVGALLAVPGDLLAQAVWRAENPHGYAKLLVLSGQSLILRQERVAVVLVLAAVGALVLPRLGGARWAAAAVTLLAGLLAALGSLAWPWPLALLLLNLAPWTLPRALAWVPGTELLAPVPLARRLGAWPRAVALLVAPAVVGVWLVQDTFAGFARYEAELYQPWPRELEDPRLEVVERATPPTKCDYHDVDLVGDRVVVVAEWTNRLLNFPGGATHRLAKLWGPPLGVAMDSETDPATGVTWYQGGYDHIASARWTGDRWLPGARSAPFGRIIPITYVKRYRDRLAVFSVNAASPTDHPWLVTYDLPAMQSPRLFQVRRRDGSLLPTARDVEWIPPLNRFVLAPDMGERLYLVNPDDGIAEPWIEVPAMNGRPSWSPELGRLIVPQPTRFAIWFVDPATGAVESLPTQLGVRTADVDVERNLLVTASVATGQVLIQRLDTGWPVDRIGTVMPMVRHVELATGRGEAWLTTWTTLYRFRYVPE